VFAVRIAGKVSDPDTRTSAFAGLWAGLVVFVIYVVGQFNRIQDVAFTFRTVPGIRALPMIWGLLVGFVFLWLVRALSPTKLVGLITLALAAVSTSALFTYTFINSLRVSVLYWILGAALGILLHIVLFPASIRNVVGPTRVSPPQEPD